jgi:hypothetical protein
MTQRCFFGLIWVVSAFVLSGCRSTSPPALDAASPYLFSAEAIPVAVAQALTLQERMSEGKTFSALTTTDIHTLTSVDFYGVPFTHINITAPRPIGDPWEFASSLTGSEWAGEGDDTLWTITITGATDTRTPISQQEVGLGSFLNFYKTVKALGGPTKLKNLIAVTSTVYFLEDTSGKLCDPTTLAPVPPEVLRYARDVYDEIVASNTATTALASNKAAWARFLESSEARSIEAATVEGGELDVRTFVQTLATFHRQPDASGYIRGAMPKIPGSRVFFTYPSGFDQYPEDYGRAGQKWSMYLCNLGTLTKKDVIGCGPASFAGLLDFQFKYRQKKILGRTYDARNDFASRQGMRWALTNPVGAEQLPLITSYMGTCWFLQGGLTRALNYVNGAKRFLADYAPSLRITASASVGFRNRGNAAAKLDLLKWAMWRNSTGWPTSSTSEVPVVAQYFHAFLRAHFAAIREWRHKTVLLGTVPVLEVRTENHENLWINLADTGNYETGVYAIY